jgi:hypothetical protein
VLFLLLSFQTPIGRADTQHQTIPTAPPTTAIIPTSAPTETQTQPPQITVIYTQPTQVLPSQTPGIIASPTVETITSSPSKVPSATVLPGDGTIPNLTVTLSSPVGTTIPPTSSIPPTVTVIVPTKTLGSSGILYYLLIGAIIVIFVIGVIWYLKLRHR